VILPVLLVKAAADLINKYCQSKQKF